jgi:hypothetical protein
MTTYATMRTRILDELADENLTAAQVNNAILSAIKHHERKPWWFNQKVGTFSTVADQELYTSSDLSDIPNMVQIQSLLVTSGSSTKAPLRALDNGNIEDMQDGTVTGEPEYYSRFADKIRLYPIPDAVYTMTASYVYKLTALSADSDTNSWTNECEELTRQAAKRILAADLLHDDDLAMKFGTLEAAARDTLMEEYRTRLGNVMLRVDWPFGRQYIDPITGQ